MQNSQTVTINNNGEWVQSCVKDLTYHPQYGWTTSAKNLSKGLKLLRTTDISKEQVNWDTVPVCTIEPNEKEKYLIREKDILVSRAGSIGLSYYVQNPPPAVFASYLIRFRALPDKIRAKLLYYFFQSPLYWSAIGAGELGIAIPNVNATKLGEVEVSYPTSFDEQDKLIARLDYLLPNVTDTKNKVYKAKKIINKFRQSVLSAAVTGKLTESWREKNPEIETAGELLKKIADDNGVFKTNVKSLNTDNLKELPEKWVWCRFEQIGELARGKSKHRPRNDPKLFDGKYPFIQTGDVARSTGLIKNYSQTYNDVGLAQSRLFPKNTLCITIAANIADTGILGIDACFPDSVVGFIPYRPLLVEYFYYFLNIAKDDLEQFAPETAQKNINLGILNELAIPLPPYEEQKEIVRRVNYLLDLKQNIDQQVIKAEEKVDKLTQSILSKAFRGEL